MATTPKTKQVPSTRGARAASRAALDVLLTDAAVERAGLRRFLQPNATAKAVAGLARRPDRVAKRISGLGLEVARLVAVARSWRRQRATGGSRTAPGRTMACSTGWCRPTSRSAARWTS